MRLILFLSEQNLASRSNSLFGVRGPEACRSDDARQADHVARVRKLVIPAAKELDAVILKVRRRRTRHWNLVKGRIDRHIENGCHIEADCSRDNSPNRLLRHRIFADDLAGQVADRSKRLQVVKLRRDLIILPQNKVQVVVVQVGLLDLEVATISCLASQIPSEPPNIQESVRVLVQGCDTSALL